MLDAIAAAELENGEDGPVAGESEIDAVADELYQVPPERFIEERDARVAQARAGGDRELGAAIGRLRRPTVTAWVVNLLVRDQPEAVEELSSLGEELRRAQSELRGSALRGLLEQRQRVVAGLVQAARRRAGAEGHAVSAQTAYEIEQTLHAALADPDVAEEVRSGRLVKPVIRTGFGGEGFGEAGADVVPPTELAGRRAARARDTAVKAKAGDGRAGGAGRTGTAERADAAGQASRAERAERAERDRLDAAEERRRAERERLTQQLDAALADVEAAETELAEAEARVGEVERGREEAAAAIEDLEARLAQARRTVRDSTLTGRDARRRRDQAARNRDGLARRLAELAERLRTHDDRDRP